MLVSELENAVGKAEHFWRRNDFVRARNVYLTTLRERLIFVGETGQKFIAGDLLVIERLADLALLFGNFSAADDLLSAMIALCEDAGNFWVADYARLKRIHLALGNAGLREVREIFAAMSPRIGDITKIEFSPDGLAKWEASCGWRDTDEADRCVLLAILLLEIGRTLCCLGQYADALAALERGRIRAADAKQPDLARQLLPHFLLAAAAALLEKGEIWASEKTLADFSKNFPSPEIALRINHLELQSRLNLLRGNLGASLAEARQLIRLCRENSFEQAAITATLNLANVLIVLNQTYLAEEILREAEETFSVDGGVTLRARIASIKNLARTRATAVGDDIPIAPSVTDLWEESVRSKKDTVTETIFNFLELPQSDNFLTFFEERALGFQQVLGFRNISAAQNILEWLRQVFGASDSTLIQNRLLTLEAMAAYYSGKFEYAENLFRQSETFFNEQKLVPELWQLRRFRQWCHQHAASGDAAEGEPLSNSTDKLLEKMTASLLPEDRSAFLINKWTAEEEFIASEINAVIELREQMKKASAFKRSALKWRMLKRLNRLLYYIDRHKYLLALSSHRENGIEKEKLETREMSLFRRLISLPKNTAVLIFLVLPDRVLIVKSTKFSLDFGISFTTRLELRQLVKDWHLRMRKRAMTRANETPVRGLGKAVEASADNKLISDSDTDRSEVDLLYKISDALQLPALIKTLPPRITHLTIIPDDILHGFPFAAVKTDERFLIEKYSLSVDFENQPRPARSAKKRPPVLIGANGAGSTLGELAGIEDEINAVSQWCQTKFSQPPQILDGEKTGKKTALRAIADCGFLHIAGHGVFDPNDPHKSGLLLSEKNGAREMLDLEDFFGLDIKNVRHITLSSCWSADHYILPGRWVVGLPETLRRAGAHSTLGSIWFVDDAVAVSLMQNFYGSLNKISRGEALRLAQIACLNRELPNCENLDTSHPFFWAGFILYGKIKKL